MLEEARRSRAGLICSFLFKRPAVSCGHRTELDAAITRTREGKPRMPVRPGLAPFLNSLVRPGPDHLGSIKHAATLSKKQIRAFSAHGNAAPYSVRQPRSLNSQTQDRTGLGVRF